jgi:hypothetical protein
VKIASASVWMWPQGKALDVHEIAGAKIALAGIVQRLHLRSVFSPTLRPATVNGRWRTNNFWPIAGIVKLEE